MNTLSRIILLIVLVLAVTGAASAADTQGGAVAGGGILPYAPGTHPLASTIGSEFARFPVISPCLATAEKSKDSGIKKEGKKKKGIPEMLVSNVGIIKFLLIILILGVGNLIRVQREKKEKKLAEERAKKEELERRIGKIY